jgi:serine beta-lactamase-like protein LACTB, mitochondrial
MKRTCFGLQTGLPKLLLAALAVGILSPAAHAQSGGKWTRAALAGNAVESYRKKFDVPGISVAVAKNGKIIYMKGFGWKNVEKKIKASEITRYRLASVSKPITAILVKELWPKGNHFTNIRGIIKGLPSHHNYTLRDLLSHQAGVRHYKKGKDPTKNVSKHYARATNAMTLFVKDKLVAKPGTKYSYSTHGFTILAAAVEKKTGEMFWLYAKKRFLAWGLKDLELENSGLDVAVNRAQIYKREKGKNKVAKRDDISWKCGGGGMQCSARDLCKLGILLADGKILPKSELNLLWTRQKTRDGKTTGYGLGWGVGSEGGRKVVAHSGSQNGAASYWRIYPNEKVVIVVLSNRNGHKPAKLGKYLGQLVFANPKTKPIATW